MTVTGSIDDLNTALAGTGIASGGSLVVTVRYDVVSGQGGNSSTLTLTATSRRDGSATASDNTVVTPALTGTVTVTPDGGQSLERLPSNGAQYTATFSVTNGMSGTDDFDLVASTDNGNLTIVSVNGVVGSSAQVSFAASENQNIDVVYTVNAVAAGSTDNLNLLATSVSDNSVTDTGYFDLTVVQPAITVTKEALSDDKAGPVSGSVLPGQYIQYHVVVENSGTGDASSISVSDALPGEVTFDSTSDDGGTPAWSIAESSGTVTATLSTLAAGATREFWIRVQVR